MRLSVAIITYNRSNEVINAVGSVIGQLTECDQIVIVDNGSNAGHAESLEGYSHQLRNGGYDVILKHVGSNLGVAGGRNVAWHYSQGDAVLFLDDDSVVEDDRLLDKIRQYLDENKDVGALAIRIFEPVSGKYRNSRNIFLDSDGHQIAGIFNGGAHVINKRVFDVEKMYPDTLFWGAEERYATLRIWGQGLYVHLLPDTTVLHHPETTSEGRITLLKEINENGLANTFVIQRLLLPSVFLPIVTLTFISRLFYRQRRYGIDVRKVLHLARERYDRRFRQIIPMKAVLDYASKFGYRYLL